MAISAAKGFVHWVCSEVSDGSFVNVELYGGSQLGEPKGEDLSLHGQGQRWHSQLSDELIPCLDTGRPGFPGIRIRMCRDPRWETCNLGTARAWVRWAERPGAEDLRGRPRGRAVGVGLPRACLHGHLKASASPRQGFVSAVHCSIPLAWHGAWHGGRPPGLGLS